MCDAIGEYDRDGSVALRFGFVIHCLTCVTLDESYNYAVLHSQFDYVLLDCVALFDACCTVYVLHLGEVLMLFCNLCYLV